MKPNFALDFRNDAVTLLHRTPRGWQMVGQVAMDAPDMTEALSYLRSTALGLSPKGMTTKLVIPGSQILYTTVRAPAAEPGRKRKQVMRALEGLTPYAVADLVYDIRTKDADVQVAIIARETLAEAEAFATEHRFNPVSFVAVPDAGGFPGEPWFGVTTLAATLVPEGETLERDQEPIEILSRDPVSRDVAPPPAATSAPEPSDAAPESAPVVTVADATLDAHPPLAAQDDTPRPASPVGAQDVSETAAATPVTELAPLGGTPEPAAEPEPELDLALGDAIPEVRLSEAPIAEPVLAAPLSDLVMAPEPVAEEPQPAPTIAEPVPVDEAPMALDVVDDLADAPLSETASAPARVLSPSIPDDTPPAPATSIMMAFASRRAAETAENDAAMKTPSVKTGAQKSTTGKTPPLSAVTAARGGPAPKVATFAPRTPTTVVPMPSRASALPTQPTVKPPIKGSAASKALRGLGSLVTAPGIPGSKDRKTALQSTPPTGPNSAASAAAATLTNSTVPPKGKPAPKPYSGGLGSRNMVERGKPRYLGLILTGILLVFLALVAAWANFFLASQDPQSPATNAVVEAPPPSPEDEMLADLQDPAELQPVETTPAAPVAETQAEPVAPPTESVAEIAPVPPAPEAAPDTQISTETAAPLRPAADLQDEIFLAAMDEPPAMTDALSLPLPAARNDPPPAPATPPPPFGTVYQFDAAGNILPTPDGILTPEGVLLFAGRPQLVPPPRPAGLAPPPAPTVDTPPVAAETPTVAPEVFADPALAGARPRARPDTLLPPTQNADDDASLAPATGSRFASLRPRARPVELAAADTAAVTIPPINPPSNPLAGLGAQGASLTAQANATAAAGRSPQAVVVSRIPAARPKDLSRAVEAAVAIASRQPEPTPPVDEPEARTEPEADDEPELAKAMPRLPTSTSVAKQATFVNAINLGKVNLIGVYGTQSNRYALVRQANGRYKKVKVGDNIDGGRVAAITPSEVRYQKSGRMVTLALPKG